MRNLLSTSVAVLAAMLAQPALAQSAPTGTLPPAEEVDAGVLGGDFIIGIVGVALVPSYEGSDDYTVTPFPAIAGRIGGVGIAPRAGGLALDLIADANSASNVHFQFGPAVRARFGRTGDTKDDVVELLPDLDTAIEVGANAGITVDGVLHPYDMVSVSADVRWDVAGAHDGMVVTPGVSYVTPLSRGTIATLNVSGEYVDDSFAEYYYSVTPGMAAASGLPVFDAEGGFKSVTAALLLGFDLSGDVTDGGLSLVAAGGYTRLMGDAADTPFTSIRGSADQWFLGGGLAYTF